MQKFISSLVLALLVGAAAAFFRPVAPYQVIDVVDTKPALFPRGGALKDAGLDNPAIAEDQNITPARKCGFCMGVSTLNAKGENPSLSFEMLMICCPTCAPSRSPSHFSSEPGKPTVQ